MRTGRLLAAALLVLLAWADPPLELVRKIAKKPAFTQKTQQYVLLLLGQKPQRQIWIVRDGDDYYIDRNGNGELTEPGEKVTAKPFKPYYADNFVDLGSVVDAHGVSHGPLILNLPALPEPVVYYGGVSLQIAKKFKQVVPKFQVARSPETAPVFHFDGPLSAGLSTTFKFWNMKLTTDANDLTLSRGKKKMVRAWVATQIDGWAAVYCDPFSLTAKKEENRPVLQIDYDNRDPKGPPIVESFRLEEVGHPIFDREVQAPKNAGAKAKLKLTFPTLPEVPAVEIEVKVGD